MSPLIETLSDYYGQKLAENEHLKFVQCQFSSNFLSNDQIRSFFLPAKITFSQIFLSNFGQDVRDNLAIVKFATLDDKNLALTKNLQKIKNCTIEVSNLPESYCRFFQQYLFKNLRAKPVECFAEVSGLPLYTNFIMLDNYLFTTENVRSDNVFLEVDADGCMGRAIIDFGANDSEFKNAIKNVSEDSSSFKIRPLTLTAALAVLYQSKQFLCKADYFRHLKMERSDILSVTDNKKPRFHASFHNKDQRLHPDPRINRELQDLLAKSLPHRKIPAPKKKSPRSSPAITKEVIKNIYSIYGIAPSSIKFNKVGEEVNHVTGTISFDKVTDACEAASYLNGHRFDNMTFHTKQLTPHFVQFCLK